MVTAVTVTVFNPYPWKTLNHSLLTLVFVVWAPRKAVTTLPNLVTASPRVVTTCRHTQPLRPSTRLTQEKLLNRIQKLLKRIPRIKH